MRDALTDFLDAWEGRRGVWGQHDCALWTADWGLILTGIDGGARWRGTYDDENGCISVLRRDGGLVAVVGEGTALMGFTPLPDPLTAQRGDIGVVEVGVARGDPLLAAICVGRTWAALSERGVRYLRAQPIASWRVPLASSLLGRSSEDRG